MASWAGKAVSEGRMVSADSLMNILVCPVCSEAAKLPLSFCEGCERSVCEHCIARHTGRSYDLDYPRTNVVCDNSGICPVIGSKEYNTYRGEYYNTPQSKVIRQQSLQFIIDLVLPRNCKNLKNGCEFIIEPGASREEHERYCDFRNVSCPLCRDQQVAMNSLMRHFETSHPSRVYIGEYVTLENIGLSPQSDLDMYSAFGKSRGVPSHGSRRSRTNQSNNNHHPLPISSTRWPIFVQPHVFWIKINSSTDGLTVSANVDRVSKLEGKYFARIKLEKGHFSQAGAVKIVPSVDRGDGVHHVFGQSYWAMPTQEDERYFIPSSSVQRFFSQSTPPTFSLQVEIFTE